MLIKSVSLRWRVVLFVVTAMWAGSTVRGDTVLAPVGPAAAEGPRHWGKLIVYSAVAPSEPSAAGSVFDWEETRFPHTDYTIYRPDGTLYRKVINSFGPHDERAKDVILPSGKYNVRAKSQKEGWVIVPVTISDGKLTVVKLTDSSDAPRGPIMGSH